MKREKLIAFRGKENQQTIAKKAGVTQQTWSNWERGLTPNISTINKVAKRLGLKPEYFFSLFY